jgi:hypothetical protein
LAFLKLYFGADPAAMAEAQLAALQPLLKTYQAMRAANTGEEPRGPRQTVEAGIDYVKASIRAWERIAHEAALGAVGAARTQTERRR